MTGITVLFFYGTFQSALPPVLGNYLLSVEKNGGGAPFDR